MTGPQQNQQNEEANEPMRRTTRLQLSLAVIPLLAIGTLLGACETSSTSSPSPGTTSSPPPGRASILPPGSTSIPDHQLGLNKLSVFDVAAPDDTEWVGDAPGENRLLARVNAEAPPLVPHEMEEMLPITATENLCIDCHATVNGNKPIGTEMSPSHFTDLRNAPNKLRQEIAGARWVCVSCHVAQTDAVPLVELMK